jgi:RNA polymerase sigma factor (sigma-70 family)
VDEDFAAFAVEIAPRLMRLARTLVVSEHDAADLVQDTLVRVGTRWARVERRGNPVSYSMTILVRLNIDRHRKQSRESPTREMPDSPAPLIAESAGIPEWLSTAWPGLTPNQRTAIALRHWRTSTLRRSRR